MLRSVGDESVDILFIMGDNGKSLSDELVCDSDHGEFSRLPVLPEPRVCFPTFSIDLSLIFCNHGGYNSAAIVIKRSSFEPLCFYIIPQKPIITTWSYVTGGDPAGECVAMSAIGLIEDTKYRIRFCFDDKVSTTPSFLLIEWEDKGLLAFFNSEGGVRNLLPNTFEGTRLTFLQNLVDKLKLKYDK